MTRDNKVIEWRQGSTARSLDTLEPFFDDEGAIAPCVSPRKIALEVGARRYPFPWLTDKPAMSVSPRKRRENRDGMVRASWMQGMSEE